MWTDWEVTNGAGGMREVMDVRLYLRLYAMDMDIPKDVCYG